MSRSRHSVTLRLHQTKVELMPQERERGEEGGGGAGGQGVAEGSDRPLYSMSHNITGSSMCVFVCEH